MSRRSFMHFLYLYTGTLSYGHDVSTTQRLTKLTRQHHGVITSSVTHLVLDNRRVRIALDSVDSVDSLLTGGCTPCRCSLMSEPAT
jgi:hypothetical protein